MPWFSHASKPVVVTWEDETLQHGIDEMTREVGGDRLKEGVDPWRVSRTTTSRVHLGSQWGCNTRTTGRLVVIASVATYALGANPLEMVPESVTDAVASFWK